MSDEYEDHEGMTPSDRERDDLYRQVARLTAALEAEVKARREAEAALHTIAGLHANGAPGHALRIAQREARDALERR